MYPVICSNVPKFGAYDGSRDRDETQFGAIRSRVTKMAGVKILELWNKSDS